VEIQFSVIIFKTGNGLMKMHRILRALTLLDNSHSKVQLDLVIELPPYLTWYQASEAGGVKDNMKAAPPAVKLVRKLAYDVSEEEEGSRKKARMEVDPDGS
jgi:hypothetical protein